MNAIFEVAALSHAVAGQVARRGRIGQEVVMGPHSLHDQRSLAIHELVAERIRADASVLDIARKRVAEWQRTCTMNPKYPQAWSELLNGPLERLLELLVDPGELATELRHVSPFAGTIDMATRERVWRQVKERLALQESAVSVR